MLFNLLFLVIHDVFLEFETLKQIFNARLLIILQFPDLILQIKDRLNTVWGLGTVNFGVTDAVFGDLPHWIDLLDKDLILLIQSVHFILHYLKSTM